MTRIQRVNQDDLRNHNLAVVLTTLVQSPTPLSRADLAKETGLTKATLSVLADILLSNHVLEQRPAVSGQGNGRPSTPLDFASGTWVGIGVQINTDGYGASVVDFTGAILMEDWVEAQMSGIAPEKAFSLLEDLINAIEIKIKRKKYCIVGAGLALPGLVAAHGRLINAPNLGWKNLELRSFPLISRFNMIVDNEANLAAVAQIPGFATKRGSSDSVLDPLASFLYFSTDIGVGGAFINHGLVMRGDHGFGGELGHVSVALDGPICRCGRRGCLEMYAGRRELVKNAGIAEGVDAENSENLAELIRRWNRGDTRAVAAIDTALTALASAAASAINILDVDTVILGGFWASFEKGLADRLREKILQQVLARFVLDLKVQIHSGDSHPALHGAAFVALKQLIEHPAQFLEM